MPQVRFAVATLDAGNLLSLLPELEKSSVVLSHSCAMGCSAAESAIRQTKPVCNIRTGYLWLDSKLDAPASHTTRSPSFLYPHDVRENTVGAIAGVNDFNTQSALGSFICADRHINPSALLKIREGPDSVAAYNDCLFSSALEIIRIGDVKAEGAADAFGQVDIRFELARGHAAIEEGIGPDHPLLDIGIDTDGIARRMIHGFGAG